MFPSDLGGSRAVYDFLGPDIDAGFRASSHSAKHLLVLSAELGWLLSGKCGPDFPPRLRVVGYKQLKGVWSGRYYPIVVYHRDWNDLPKQLSYDDRFTSEVIRRASGRSTLLEQSLAKVFDETGRRGRAEKLAERIEKSTPPTTTAVKAAVPDDMEVHCAAVCFNEHGDVLVGKRPETKRVQAGRWEFGCGRLRNGQDFATCIKTDYLADFGVEVELVPAEDPVPIRTYAVTKSGRRVPGIIFVAKILGKVTSPNFNREKHTEIKWLAPKDARNFEASGCVPDFAGTIDAAVRLLDQLAAPTT
jgi:isopentenyldiphosphate isomerase